MQADTKHHEATETTTETEAEVRDAINDSNVETTTVVVNAKEANDETTVADFSESEATTSSDVARLNIEGKKQYYKYQVKKIHNNNDRIIYLDYFFFINSYNGFI